LTTVIAFRTAGEHRYSQTKINDYFLAGVILSIQDAIESGLIPRQPVAPLAHIIMGALHEASMLIAHADDQVTTRREVNEVVDRLFSSIRTTTR
jgi:hypothetical protein